MLVIDYFSTASAYVWLFLNPAYDCDDDETYEPEGPLCRPTCSAPLLDKYCPTSTPGEVCVCGPQEVLSTSGDCMPAVDCGCIDSNTGIHYAVCLFS